MHVNPMPADTKTAASIPFWIPLLCIILLCILAAVVLNAGTLMPLTGSSVAPAGTGAGTLPACRAVGQELPVEPAVLAASGLDMSLPPAGDRVPYTKRNFDDPVEASIAWWMSPGFMDNTTEFRGFERKTTEGKKAYPEEHRIFFSFIEDNLDIAEQESVLKSHHILFRGISPHVAGMVMNSSAYHEPAFASTSYDISVSLDGFGVRSPDGYRNILVLKRDAGDHALYINEDEREYLLPRAMDWTVVKAENVENLTVTADFTLHNRTTGTASFDHVRLIYLEPAGCIAATT